MTHPKVLNHRGEALLCLNHVPGETSKGGVTQTTACLLAPESETELAVSPDMITVQNGVYFLFL